MHTLEIEMMFDGGKIGAFWRASVPFLFCSEREITIDDNARTALIFFAARFFYRLCREKIACKSDIRATFSGYRAILHFSTSKWC